MWYPAGAAWRAEADLALAILRQSLRRGGSRSIVAGFRGFPQSGSNEHVGVLKDACGRLIPTTCLAATSSCKFAVRNQTFLITFPPTLGSFCLQENRGCSNNRRRSLGGGSSILVTTGPHMFRKCAQQCQGIGGVYLSRHRAGPGPPPERRRPHGLHRPHDLHMTNDRQLSDMRFPKACAEPATCAAPSYDLRRLHDLCRPHDLRRLHDLRRHGLRRLYDQRRLHDLRRLCCLCRPNHSRRPNGLRRPHGACRPHGQAQPAPAS